MVGLLFVLYAALSVQQHRKHLTSGFDLGIFEQEVRSYAHLHLPASELKGPHFALLGDHFSPIMATIAPLYRVFPSALTLLVVQAALLAVAAFPLTRWGIDRLGCAGGVLIGLAYGLSWGIAQAVGFDVHEVAFAVPLLAFGTVALGRNRLDAAVAWSMPLVLVKEDLGLTVAIVGLIVAAKGNRRLGVHVALFGVAATVIETWILIPAFAGGRGGYTSQLHGPLGAAQTLLTSPYSNVKLATLALIILPTLGYACRSPLALLLIPTLLWRFAADNQSYWGTLYHYNAVLMPVVFAAFIDALGRSGPRRRWPILGCALVTAALLHMGPLPELASPSFWRLSPHDRAISHLLRQIPNGARVSASNWIAPQLTNRDDVSLFGLTPTAVARPDYIIVDTAANLQFPISFNQQKNLLEQAESSGYRVQAADDGVLLLEAAKQR